MELFDAYASDSAIEGYAIKAAMLFPSLILEKPFLKSKPKDHLRCFVDVWNADYLCGTVVRVFLSFSRRVSLFNINLSCPPPLIMRIIKQDLQDADGLHQFCTGFDSGCESAIHCMSRVLDTNEASLFVDASNAFNSLNRAITLRNV